MRLAVSLLGRQLFEITTDPAAPPGPNGVEGTSGGQFEIGFTPPPPGEVVCRDTGRAR